MAATCRGCGISTSRSWRTIRAKLTVFAAFAREPWRAGASGVAIPNRRWLVDAGRSASRTASRPGQGERVPDRRETTPYTGP